MYVALESAQLRLIVHYFDTWFLVPGVFQIRNTQCSSGALLFVNAFSIAAVPHNDTGVLQYCAQFTAMMFSFPPVAMSAFRSKLPQRSHKDNCAHIWGLDLS